MDQATSADTEAVQIETTDMFELLFDISAQRLACSWGSHVIGLEHVLTALMVAEDRAIGAVFNNLFPSTSGKDKPLAPVVAHVRSLSSVQEAIPLSSLSWTQEAAEIKERAKEIAQDWDCGVTGLEHVLVALVECAGGIPQQTMQHFGITLERVRDVVRKYHQDDE